MPRVLRRLPLALTLGLAVSPFARPSVAGADHAPLLWPQFRGPNGTGVAPEGSRPPTTFGPTQNARWKVACPEGHSSPIVAGENLVLTAFQGRQLLTLAFRRDSGRVAWRRGIDAPHVEEVHPSLGSPATPTPVTDGNQVYVFFGSFGLRAYGLDGTERWSRPVALPQTEYGSSSSPVIAGDHVVQLLDQDGGSYLLAVHRHDGEVAWKIDRPDMRRGFGTPVLWSHHGLTDLVVPGTLWLVGLDPGSGQERWRVSGLARITCTTPVVSEDLVLTASWTTGGDRGAGRIEMPEWDAYLAQHDADHDGRFTPAELPTGPVKERIKHLDGNRNGYIEKTEWLSMADIFGRVENQAFAVQADARGAVSDGTVLWRFKRGLPYVASPIAYRGRFYLVKNGGMLTCLDPRTGHAYYQEERLGAVGDYYASLTAADGRIYAISRPGVVTVVKAGDTFQTLARNDLGEPVQATPAIADNTLYLRTATWLYAFEEPTPDQPR